MDTDQANMLGVLLSGADMTSNGLALEALREVGPGSHFLGSSHTLSNFETAFYRSLVADNNSFEQWEAEGSLGTSDRANSIYKKMLKEYEPPPLDESIDESLNEFISKKKDAFPDMDY